MKFRLNFNLETWITGVEVEANSEKEAISELRQMSLEDMLYEGGEEKSTDITDIDSEVIQCSMKADVYGIEWDEDDVDDEDLEDLSDEYDDVLIPDMQEGDDEYDLVSDAIFKITGHVISDYSLKNVRKF